jgi:hypothetical protein
MDPRTIRLKPVGHCTKEQEENFRLKSAASSTHLAHLAKTQQAPCFDNQMNRQVFCSTLVQIDKEITD